MITVSGTSQNSPVIMLTQTAGTSSGINNVTLTSPARRRHPGQTSASP